MHVAPKYICYFRGVFLSLKKSHKKVCGKEALGGFTHRGRFISPV